MKKLFILLYVLIVFASISVGQNEFISRKSFYEKEWENWKTYLTEPDKIETDTSIDVQFYHIGVSIAIDSQYISGCVYIKLKSLVNNLNSIKLNLQSSLIADSVTLDAISCNAGNNLLNINLSGSFNIGEEIEIKVYYHGVPVLANNIKGLVYTTHGNNEPLIATLSTPFLSHYWWPCKDGPQDKADSAYIDITIKDTIVSGIPLIAVSNGILSEVDSSSGIYKTFKWKHRYPVVPYYLMAAISNYRIINQFYTGSSSSFPLIYYVFNSDYASALAGVSQMPAAFDVYSNLFGNYPFSNEKYGMTQLGFYGAIENQTNTIINNMSQNWYYTSVHELSHMWFGDMITCQNWHHAWVNEGFASYAEALLEEHLYGFNSYKTYMQGFEFYNGGTLYLQNDTDPFNIFVAIVYYKGAYVLHMLRGIMGDSVFFNCLKTYSTSPQFMYKNATTEDFEQVCETVSGQNLEYFFDQWIYDQYYPKYAYNFYSHPSNHTTALTIVQKQINFGWRPVFKMPLEIKFHFSNGTDSIVRVINDAQTQTFYFNFNDSATTVAIDPNKWVLRNVTFDPTIVVNINESFTTKIQLTIYPNPTGNNIIIESTLLAKENELEIMNLNGQVLITQVITENKTPVDVSGLKSGVYFVKFSNNNTVEVKKFVKE